MFGSDLTLALGIFAGMFLLGFFLGESGAERVAYGVATLFLMAFAIIAHYALSTGLLKELS